MSLTGDLRPEYYRDLYGDATITWVPPVTNYAYAENVSKRGINNTSFRWEEVTIDLSTIQSGAILDFLMPDYYIVQITPDIGWHDTLAMFGETKDSSIFNPHLKNLGPFSITAGTLIDKSDNSVLLELTEDELTNSVIDGFPKYLWRAVPWANGNPGVGGLPSSFEWVSSIDQIVFTVDEVQKETRKNTQVISGTKNVRVNITIESSNDIIPFVEQTSTTWKVIINIDRPNIKLTIVATDEGGSAISKYYVDLDYSDRPQFSSHVWNPFDGFALLASLDRLPGESNQSLRNRTIDAFQNRGGTHYKGLVFGINRELGLARKDNALILKRNKNSNTLLSDPSISIDVTHTRISITCNSFITHDELVEIDSYYNIVKTDYRIVNILSVKTSSNQEIDPSLYEIFNTDGESSGKSIWIDPVYTGILKVTYQYFKDINFSDNPTVSDVIQSIEAITTPIGNQLLSVTLDGTMSGSESSDYLYKITGTINSSITELVIGWSPIGLFSINDHEYKWSFADSSNLFFNSKYYQYVIELKHHSNIEWGYIVADKNYWDAVDADWYGRDSLPAVFDIKLSKYKTALPIGARTSEFDGWEALRMSYYYNGNLIKNIGFSQSSFKSGVGYTRDCAVSVVSNTVSAVNTKINFNPTVVKQKDLITFSNESIANIVIDI